MSTAFQATADFQFPPAEVKTMYFVGVTTGKSSIMTVFPKWAEHLGLGEVRMQGIDCKWHDDPEVYHNVVEFIKEDELSLGALVTTHKIDLLTATREMFDYLDPYAELFGEVSSISKRGDRLHGHAKDPITSGLALEAFLPENHWEKTGGEAFVIGAGGSAIAITSYMMEDRHADNRPSKIVVCNRSEPRLEEMKKIHKKLDLPVPVEYHLTPEPEMADALMADLPPHSVVMNSTGLGKDGPGSPLTDAAIFPENGIAWDFNYRFSYPDVPHFLDQAKAQAEKQNLQVEDGWVYFIHGWTRVIAEVFDIKIPTSGPEFDVISKIAAEVRR